HVADAALLMATLSRPDVRDATSLPYQPLAWADLPADPQPVLHGRRIGLLLDAGWGLPLDPEIRTAIENAAAWAATAGAHVEPLPAFTTREMADGINLFWRTRSWLDISALPPERQALVLPFIRAWVAAAAGFTAAQLFHGYSQFAALRDAAVAARHLQIPVHVAAARFDPAVPPPGQFAIYNALAGHRELFVLQTGHFDHQGRAAEEMRLQDALAYFFNCE
ncbi:MAG TPA: hypothetical protein PLW86_18970, partial [Rhodocyclaceae bacterium]|nr:hypothetical protein [Rhodocyclaceae bacterium]